VGGGLPRLSVVGLAETAVKESRDRVKAAIQHSQFEMPGGHVIVNLAPADLPKSGGRYDLAIAVGILAATGQIPFEPLDGYEFLGELGLSGDIRTVPAVLPAVIAAAGSGRVTVLPCGSADEAALAGQRAHEAATLLDVARHFLTDNHLPEIAAQRPVPEKSKDAFRGIFGQALARRAMVIAAAGGHNLLLSGPPGTGKSMLAQRLPALLPPLTESEAMETAAIQAVAGEDPVSRWAQRPFRAPHHTSTVASLVGGGSIPRPGEISLAHNGVLFLDELPEWSRAALESLREPLESGCITVARARARVCYPARFRLAAAMNPCPCGYAGDALRECSCTPTVISNYLGRISGPLLDRIDVGVAVQRPRTEGIFSDQPPAEEAAHSMLPTPAALVEKQMARQGCMNALLPLDSLTVSACPEALTLLGRAADRLGLSMRRCCRLLRVARTICDLEGADRIGRDQVAEALSLRPESVVR
jgi:magnesium chelatase family protein